MRGGFLSGLQHHEARLGRAERHLGRPLHGGRHGGLSEGPLVVGSLRQSVGCDDGVVGEGVVVDQTPEASARLPGPAQGRVEALALFGGARPGLGHRRHHGDEARAAELFERAQRFQGEGWSANIDALWLRLALVRDDRQEAERLVEARFDRDFVFGPSHWATLLDALAVLRRADRLEQLAPRGLQPSTYLEPFALRALGVVRCDDDLLARADECFATLGLEWHRAQTERLLAGF